MDNVWRDIGVTVIPCNWLQCMENSLDPVHTEWLHGHYYNYVMEPLKDEHGQHITDFVLGQDMMAWVTQGPIAERPLERLGESDKGIILYRRLLRELMAT